MFGTLVAAAALTVFIGVVHSWLGEVKLIGPLLAPENRAGLLKSGFARGVLRFAWHLTTLAWWGLAAIVAAIAFWPLEPAGRCALAIIAAVFFLHGAIVLWAGRGRHHAWIVFFAIAALAASPLFS